MNMQKFEIEIRVKTHVFAEDTQDAHNVVKDAFLLPPAHLIDPEVTEVTIS